MNDIIGRLIGLLDQLVEERGVPKDDILVNKNIIKSSNSTFDSGKSNSSNKLSPREKARLTESITLFNTLFFEAQKRNTKDTTQKTLVSSIAKSQDKQKDYSKGPENMESGEVSGILKLITVVGTIGAFIYGLTEEGPFKGTMKIISKIGGKALWIMAKNAFKLLIEPFEKVYQIANKLLGGKTEGKTLSKIGGQLFSKGIFKSMAKFFSPLLKGLKKIPVIGTIISLAFAVSRLRKGDITGGIIDVLSALSGLLYLVPGGQPFAFALSVGFDVLNAWLDYKASAPENIGRSKGDILMEMANKIGDYLAKNMKYLPIIGGLEHFGSAYAFISSGNMKEGLNELGKGLLGFVGGQGLVDGFAVLSGWLNSPKETSPDIKSDNSWSQRLKMWIQSKLKDLPGWLAEPLRWFGILDDGGAYETGGIVTSSIKDASIGVVDYVMNIWTTIKNSMVETLTTINNFIGEKMDVLKGVKNTITESAENTKNWAVKNASDAKKWTLENTNKATGWISDSVTSVLGIKEPTKNWVNEQIITPIRKEVRPEPNKNVETVQKITSDDAALHSQLLKKDNEQNTSMNLLYKASMMQVKLLGDLVNLSSGSLKELRRMNGSTGSNIAVVSPQPQSTPSKQMMTIPNNRSGYATSAYSL